jgi:hypothetical protein
VRRNGKWFDGVSLIALAPAFACALAVIAMVAHNHYNVRTTRDVGADDEGWYVAGGVLLGKSGFPNAPNGWPIPELGPLHCLSYFALSKLYKAPLELYYAAWELRTMLLALAIFVLVRRARGPWWQALLASFFFVNCKIADVWPFPMHTATLVILGGVIAASFTRTTIATLGVVTIALAFAGFCRPELLFAWASALAAFAFFVVRGARGQGTREAWLEAFAWMGGSLAPVFVGLLTLGNPLGGTRSWFAFAQHYTLGLFKAEGNTLDPWANWGPVVARDFPGANSVFEAIRANPAAFLAHVGGNLHRFPGSFFWTTVPTLEASRHIERALWLVVIAFAIVQVRRMVRDRRRESSPMKNPTRMALVFAFFCCVVPFVLSTLIVHPREHYFVPVIVLGIILVFGYPPSLPMKRVLSAKAQVAIVLAACVLAPLLTATKSEAASLSEWITRRPAKHELEGHRQRVSTYLHDRHLEGKITILEYAWGTCFYAGYDCTNYLRWDKVQPFDSFVVQRGIDLVVIDDEMRHDPRFIDDSEVADFLDHPDKHGFVLEHVPKTDVRVAFHKDPATPTTRP